MDRPGRASNRAIKYRSTNQQADKKKKQQVVGGCLNTPLAGQHKNTQTHCREPKAVNSDHSGLLRRKVDKKQEAQRHK